MATARRVACCTAVQCVSGIGAVGDRCVSGGAHIWWETERLLQGDQHAKRRTFTVSLPVCLPEARAGGADPGTAPASSTLPLSRMDSESLGVGSDSGIPTIESGAREVDLPALHGRSSLRHVREVELAAMHTVLDRYSVAAGLQA